MRSITFLVPVLSTMLLTSCAQTNSGAMAAGDGTYVLYRQSGAFPTGKQNLLAEALNEANQKCLTERKKFVLINTAENPGPYILGNYPKATITFKCE
jgi:hypothetical protein